MDPLNKMDNSIHQRVIKQKPILKIQTKENKAQKKLIEEIDSLKLIYIDKVIGIPAEFGYIKAIQITILPDQIKTENEALANVVLGMHFPQEYPTHVPKIDFIQTEGFTIQEQELLFQDLFDTALNSSGDAMIYGIVVRCQQVVTNQHDKHYQNKISTRNLYDIFMQDEKSRLKESKRKMKLDEKENNKDSLDEQSLRLKFLEQREKDIPEYEEYEFSNAKKSPKVQAWQLLNNQEILLIHLLKIVMKQIKNQNNKQLGELLKIFEITTKKELIKLISPKYEVLFNNLLISKFDKYIKKEQENIDQRQAELLNKKINDKNLNDRATLMNIFFCNSFSSSGSNKPILEQQQQSSPQQQQQQQQQQQICCIQQQNRLQTDFEIVQTLGKGAFGEVFKAKNKIDGRFYAIKKIKVPYGAALNRILREVDLLSRLHHRHVIRYYQAWIDESDDQGDELYISDEETDIQIGSGFTVNNSSHYRMNSHQSNSVLSNNQFINSNAIDKKVLVLFIQTEYCTKTLRKQIDEVYPTVNDPGFIWNQFRQILEAMVYTHQQKIIHRDLKPENIFLDVTGDIKIGDFGLAKHTSKQTHNVMYTASVDDQGEIPEILDYISKVSKFEEQDMKLLDRTLNVGTYFYCPTNNKEFDEKRDIYALGVILLEMWHPFQNQRERMKILNDLKQSGKLPKRFSDCHPRQSNLIKWMIHIDPHERPTIQEILHSEFIPPKVEDEYFKEAIKVLGTSSNESIYYQRLISALFQNKRLCYIDRDRMFLRKELNVRQFYIPQIHQFMLQQCILQIETPFLIDRPKHQNQCNQPLVQMMNYSGETVLLRNHLRNSFEKYLQNINNKLLQNRVMKCYEIGQIYEKQGSQILVQNELSYDQIIINDNGLLNNLITSIQLLTNIGLKPIKIRLNYEPLIQELLVGIQIYDKINQRKVFDYMTHTVGLNGSLNTLKLKQFILNDTLTFNAKFIHDMYIDKIDKLIQIFTYKSILNQINIQEQFKYNFSDNGNNIIKDLVDIQTNFDKTFQILRKIKESQGIIIPNVKLYYDAQINNKQFGFRNGYHFSIDVQEFDQPILNGGSYKKGFKKLQTICSVLFDAPTKIEINPNYFGGIKRSNSQCLNPKLDLPLSRLQSDTFSQGVHISQICKQKIEIQGFSVNLEHIDEIFSLKQPKTLFKYQVLICSMGSNLGLVKREFQQQCQLNEVSCLIYNDEDYCQFEEYVSFADKNDIKVIVLLKDKLYQTKNKAFVRYKKDKNTKVDKELSLEEFTTFLHKNIQK